MHGLCGGSKNKWPKPQGVLTCVHVCCGVRNQYVQILACTVQFKHEQIRGYTLVKFSYITKVSYNKSNLTYLYVYRFAQSFNFQQPKISSNDNKIKKKN